MNKILVQSRWFYSLTENAGSEFVWILSHIVIHHASETVAHSKYLVIV